MYLWIFVTRFKLRKTAIIYYRTLVSISNYECTVRKNALKNIILSKSLKMWMCDIKLSVHLTIEYTVTGDVFVGLLILKPRFLVYSVTLFRQVTAVLVKILAENCMQVQLCKKLKETACAFDIHVKNCAV